MRPGRSQSPGPALIGPEGNLLVEPEQPVAVEIVEVDRIGAVVLPDDTDLADPRRMNPPFVAAGRDDPTKAVAAKERGKRVRLW